MSGLRILVVDDHPSVRRGIRALLESHAGWSVCGEASNGREAIEKAKNLEPDVVLIDLTMPEVDGLHATQEIVRADPAAQVLILTIHETETLAERAATAGAKGVLSKGDAPETLVAAIESVSRNVIHLGHSRVGRKRHIAGLFRSPEEQYRTLASFVAEGLSRGEKAIHIIDPPGREEHFARLREAGVDLERGEREGTALLIPWDEAYLRDHHFDQQAMLDLAQELLRETSEEGFALARVVAHMEWALSDPPGVHDLIGYESRLNDLLSDSHDVVICAYDLARFGANVIVDVIRSHPAVLIGSALHENPFYAAPEILLRDLKHRTQPA